MATYKKIRYLNTDVQVQSAVEDDHGLNINSTYQTKITPNPESVSSGTPLNYIKINNVDYKIEGGMKDAVNIDNYNTLESAGFIYKMGTSTSGTFPIKIDTTRYTASELQNSLLLVVNCNGKITQYLISDDQIWVRSYNSSFGEWYQPLDSKVNSLSTANIVYGNDSNGMQVGIGYASGVSEGVAANTIVQRDAAGEINVYVTPTGNNNVTNKSYVDTQDDKKLDKSNNTVNEVYVNDSGTQNTIRYDAVAEASTFPIRDNNKQLYSDLKTSSKTYEGVLTPKEYVDEKDNALDVRVTNLEARGRYLSSWDAASGLPTTYPPIPSSAVSPYVYTYRAGDYYVISNVNASGNKKPSGSYITATKSGDVWSWTIGSTDESSTVTVGDYYIYDNNLSWQLIHVDTNTHRPIKMNGTEILGNNINPLDLVEGTGIALSNNSGAVTISHSNTPITAVATPSFNKVAYDQLGHITNSTPVVKADLTGLGVLEASNLKSINGESLVKKTIMSVDDLEVGQWYHISVPANSRPDHSTAAYRIVFSEYRNLNTTASADPLSSIPNYSFGKVKNAILTYRLEFRGSSLLSAYPLYDINKSLDVDIKYSSYEAADAAAKEQLNKLITYITPCEVMNVQSKIPEMGGKGKPIYALGLGVLAECDTYAGGTAVTLNGTNKSASTAIFYAPTGSGVSGEILQSRGSGNAPTWIAQSSLNVVADVIWDSTNNKLTKTIAGTTSDIVTASELFTAMGFTATDVTIEE